MDITKFKINGKEFSVGSDVDSKTTLLEFIRNRAGLRGTKYLCLEAGCGACMVSVVKSDEAAPEAVNSCMVTILSCNNWDITTIEKVGNRLDGYHPIQKALATHSGTQCGYCSPGWVMSMYSLLESNPNMTMLEIEKSLASNLCRCTGYRPILEAFKTFAIDAPKDQNKLRDMEDLQICKKKGSVCLKKCNQDDWCVVTHRDVNESDMKEVTLEDGKTWFRVYYIKEIFDILKTKGDDSYMLVAGNMAKGHYPTQEYPRLLIDISEVKELKGYSIDQNLTVGAGCTLTELIKIFEEVSQQEYFGYLKTLRDHLQLLGHIAVRNVSTIAGNLMILYQYNEFPSDIFLLLETIGAEVTIIYEQDKTEVLSMQQFVSTDMRSKVILNIILPPFGDEQKIVFYKIMPRAQTAPASVSAGFLYKYKSSDNKVIDCRIVYGGLSLKFARASSTEIYLRNKELFHNETLQSAVGMLERELNVEEIPGKPSAAYRKQLALGLFYKGLLSLCPENIINPRFISGAINLQQSRPVSQGRQLYDTDPSQYPLTQPIPKIEALIQCAGETTYTEDRAAYPNEVYAAFVLSTVPTGTIVSIDPSRALQQPGAVAFYSAKDIPGLNSFTPIDDPFGGKTEEVFSSGEIMYFNQPIGVIVAEKKHIAESISKMVDVKYENVKNAVFDIKIAQNDPNRVSLYTQTDAAEKSDNVEKVINANVTMRGQSHFSMETVVCIAVPNEEGLEVHATTQWMDGVQMSIARALNIDQNRVDVHVRRLGGAFGLKISRSTMAAVACGLVSHKLNRPCRLIMPLTSVTRALGKRFTCSSDYEIAADSKGLIQYLNLNTYEDHGYMINEIVNFMASKAYSNCYNPSRWNYKLFDTLTDTAKNTFVRAPGNLEAIATAEMMMEHLAYALSLDPIEVRLANVHESFSTDILEVVNMLKKNADYEKRQVATLKFNTENRWKKRGLRCSLLRWHHEFPRYFTVNLSVFQGDGSVIISHGGIDMGQGVNTKAVQVCAYLLKVPLDKIQVKATSTTLVPNNVTSGGNLSTQHIIIGVQKCCLELLERLKPIRSQVTNSTWAELIKLAFAMNVKLQVSEVAGSESEAQYDAFSACVTETEVDILTGDREIVRVDLVQDVGQSISPEIDVGQIEGAFTMGLGYWLTERLEYRTDTGELLTDRTLNYSLPQARDIPQDFRIYFRENSYNEHMIYGSKVVGEPPICVSISAPLSIREAVTSARLESGIPTTSWFEIDGPFTHEQVCLAAETKTSDFKFN